MTRHIFIALLLLCFCASSFSQKTININESQFAASDQDYVPRSNVSRSQDARRSRELNLNPELQRSDNIGLKDTILLDLFRDRKYKAVIGKINTDINGTLVVRAKLVGYKYSYCIISTNDGKSLMTLDIPENDEYYRLNYDRNTKKHYLSDLDKSQMKYLEGAPSVIPPVNNQDSDRVKKNDKELSDNTKPEINGKALNLAGNTIITDDENTQDIIKILIFYTPAASAWATANESGIANTISLLMDKAELALNNSNTLLTLELVHSAQVNYTELNCVDDLYNLQGTTDGFMDNVHNLRDYYAADLVILLADISYTGGQGYLLSSTGGNPAYAFSLTRIQQASWTYTTIHEIGHNLGCHHHKLQNTQPGPGIFSYAAGWRWTGLDDGNYCSIMTYEDGSYFSDGVDHLRIPYFSNPGIQYLEGITGHISDGDNARTIRETKSVVSSYRTDQPSVRVINPNGGEKLLVGSTQTIRWTVSSQIENCILYYSFNGGYTLTPICTLSSNISSYNWVVPATPSTQCRIQVMGIDSPQTFSVSDLSDYNFEIATSITDPCSNISVINGCGSGYSQTFTSGGSGLWFSDYGNQCGYYSPGVEKIYSFVAPETGIYSIQVTSADGYVDYLWKSGSCSSEGWNCFADVSSPGQHGSVAWTKGTTYYILLDDENSSAGTHTFYINCPDPQDYTIGNMDVYNLVSTQNYHRAIPVTFTESGTIQSLSIFHNGGTGNLLMGIYSNSSEAPASRLGVTSSSPVNSSSGWQTISLQSPVTVSSGQTVWLSWVFENTIGVRYTTGIPARAQSTSIWSGEMPATFGTASFANYRYSVYCTYLPGVAETKINGVTEVYGLTSTTANRRAQRITFSESGMIQSVSIYHNGGTGHLLLGVYADATGVPGTRLGVIPVTAINPTAGWQTVSLTSPVPVTSGQNVWLSWIFENNPGIRYISGTPARAESPALWPGGMPDPFGSSSFANYWYSIYCTYIPGGADTKTNGITEVYGLTSTTANRRAQTITFPESGSIQSISMYHNGGSGQVLLGVYADAAGVPGARLGVTLATTINSTAGWQTISLTSPVTVTSGQKVWLAWVYENNPGIRYIAGTPARAQSAALWPGGMPDPFGASSLANYRYSIYCTYIPGETDTKINGITEVYGLTSTTANRRAQTITFAESGTIQSISMYHNGGSGRVLLGVYADAAGAPGARLGVTPAATINSTAGWQTVSLSTPVSVISGQKVWLSWVFENNPGLRYISGTPARAESTATWSGGMPTTFGTSSFASYRYSIYCTYTTGAGDEIKSVNEPLEVTKLYVEEEKVLIYPNPTDGEITVTWKNKYNHRLNMTIYNIIGKVVKKVQADPDINEISINLNGNSDGVYLFEMKDEKNDVILNRSRIIKKRH